MNEFESAKYKVSVALMNFISALNVGTGRPYEDLARICDDTAEIIVEEMVQLVQNEVGEHELADHTDPEARPDW
jgi:hypothetical protein